MKQHIQRDDHALAEWISRKLNNHDPMSVREHIRCTSGAERVRHIEGTQVVEYCAGNKVFQIMVQEIDAPKVPVHG